MSRARAFALAALLVPATVAAAGGEQPATRGLRAFIAGTPLGAAVRHAIVVDDVVGEPAAAIIALDSAQGAEVGQDVKIVVHPGGAAIFKGEVVSVEPVFQTGGDARVVVRAFDRLHRLTGERKSRTFARQTDAQIVATIAADNGLLAAPAGDLHEVHEVVVQHDQTDLEFLRERAARIGYEVFVDDQTLYFDKRPAVPLGLGPLRARPDLRLLQFHPRLSSSHTVQRVIIRGDDVNGAPVTGEARVPTLWLAPEIDDPLAIVGSTTETVVAFPLPSRDEAARLAREGLELSIAHRVSAEALVGGDAALRAGGLVVVQGAHARFDGTYHVPGVSHRFSHPESGGGYRAVLRLRRADGAMFFLPSIDDEVLVAFEHGDLREPVVVGSLWDDDECPPPCDTR